MQKIIIYYMASARRPHPHGVLPAGNQYIHPPTSPSIFRPNSLGDFSNISDEILIFIISFASLPSLSKIAQCSRALYCFGMSEELWRDCFLLYLIGEQQSQSTKSKSNHKSRNHQASAILNFGFEPTGWRDTCSKYVINRTLSKSIYTPSQPLSLPPLFSDALYRPHLCANYSFPADFTDPSREDVERRSAAELTSKTINTDSTSKTDSQYVFQAEFEKLNKPVIITKGSEEWECMKRWTGTDGEAYLERVGGETTFRATSGKCCIPVEFTMATYLSYSRCTRLDEAPLYFFDRAFVSKCPPLGRDYISSQASSLPFFSPPVSDWFSVLGPEVSPVRWVSSHLQLLKCSLRSAVRTTSGSLSGRSVPDPHSTSTRTAPTRGTRLWLAQRSGYFTPQEYLLLGYCQARTART